MKYIYLCLSILINPSLGMAQSILEDSDVIEKAYNTPNPNESLNILKRIKSDISDYSDTLQIKYHLTLGSAHGQLGNIDSSKLSLNISEGLARKTGNDFFLIKSLNTQGVLNRVLGKHEISLQKFQEALTVVENHEERKFQIMECQLLGNLGGIYYQLKDYESAKVYASRALDYSIVLKDTSELAYNYLRMAIVYQAQDSLVKSLSFNKKAGELMISLNDIYTYVYIEKTNGSIYKKQNKSDSALYHYSRAIDFARSSEDLESVAHTLNAMAEIRFIKNQLNLAEKNAIEALEIAEKSNYAIHTRTAHDILYQIALKRNDFKKALEERNKSVLINDTLNQVETRERIAELQTQYEITQKEAEIKQLSLENSLQETSLSRIKLIQIVSVIGFAIVITFLVVFFNQRANKRKAEKEAQTLQLEALQKRFIELHASPSQIAVALEFEQLNEKLYTPLTEREFDALKLSIEGKTNMEISEELFISVSTVKFHLRNTYSKMGVKNRKEAFQQVLKSS